MDELLYVSGYAVICVIDEYRNVSFLCCFFWRQCRKLPTYTYMANSCLIATICFPKTWQVSEFAWRINCEFFTAWMLYWYLLEIVVDEIKCSADEEHGDGLTKMHCIYTQVKFRPQLLVGLTFTYDKAEECVHKIAYWTMRLNGVSFHYSSNNLICFTYNDMYEWGIYIYYMYTVMNA